MFSPARLLTFAALLGLAGCISGAKPPDTYTDHNGTTTVIETDAEQCRSSCNQDDARCLDTGPAQTSPVNGPAGMFGASADCRNELSQCLRDCKSH